MFNEHNLSGVVIKIPTNQCKDSITRIAHPHTGFFILNTHFNCTLVKYSNFIRKYFLHLRDCYELESSRLELLIILFLFEAISLHTDNVRFTQSSVILPIQII